MMDRLEPPIPSTVGDHAHAVVRAALGSIPVGGSFAVELFNSIVSPPIERRRQIWMERVAADLQRIARDSAKFDPFALAKDEAFVTMLLSSTRIAVQTHAREKLDALHAAVFNSAEGRAPKQELQDAFVGFVDRFTTLHLRLLRVFFEGFVFANSNFPISNDEPLPPMLVPSIGRYGPFIESDRQLLSITLRELVELDLIQTWVVSEILETCPNGNFKCAVGQWAERSAGPMWIQHGVALGVDARAGNFVMRTSPLGSEFVEFISNPSSRKPTFAASP